MSYIRVSNGLVVEVFPFNLADMNERFEPNFVAECIECTDDVQVGDIFDEKTKKIIKQKIESEISQDELLAHAIDDAYQLIKETRLRYEHAGALVEVDGKKVRFPMELKDETRINSLSMLFAADPSANIENWKVADGLYITMTAELLQSVKIAGFAHIAAVFAIERQKRTEVANLKNVQEVQEWLEKNLEKGWLE